jgi:hypothetical protein
MISGLTQRLKQKVEERERYEEFERRNSARAKEIASAKQYKLTEFWCDNCREDFIQLGAKEVITAYEEPIAKYEGKCPYCDKKAIRFITDIHSDPYWSKSKKVKEDRSNAEIDLLQPSDPRFRYYYPEQWAEMERKKEQAELNKKYAKLK